MRILLADDHALVRDGLKPILLDLATDVEVIEAASLDEAMCAVEENGVPDLVLLDLRMPGMNGLSGLTAFHERYPSALVVIVSGQYTRRDINAALEGGASGYVPKTISGDALVSALKLVIAGERYLPSVLMEFRGDDGEGDGIALDSPLAKLTKREKEVLGELVYGNSNKQIARALGLEEITVKIHLRNVYRKMNVSNRAQAVRVALQCGWEDLN